MALKRSSTDTLESSVDSMPSRAIPRHHPGLLLGRSLAGLDAGDREGLARDVHPRSALMLAA
jgi:hypothetical protein